MSENYFTGFYFTVTPLGLPPSSTLADGGFKEVTGLSANANIEEVTSGGENRFKYRLPQVVTYPNLELKRGLANTLSPLALWVENTLQGGFDNPITTMDLSIMLLGPKGIPNMVWVAVGAYPVKWSGSELNAEKNELFIESIELAYQYLQSNAAANAALQIIS